MAKQAVPTLTEEELNAPDLDEGVLDVEHYRLPIPKDPYLKQVFKLAQAEMDALPPVEPDEDEEEDDDDDDDDDEETE